MAKLPDATEHEEEGTLKVTDRRHWVTGNDAQNDDDDREPVSTQPSVVEQYRLRAEQAEAKLHEYIAAYKQAQEDQEAFRVRLQRDVERKVELRFSELVTELIASVDDLDLALDAGRDVGAAAPVVDGVALARSRFLAALSRHGVERIDPAGELFDPRTAEALRVDPVDDPALNEHVTETLRPGYRLGEVVLRAAQVAVGKLRDHSPVS